MSKTARRTEATGLPSVPAVEAGGNLPEDVAPDPAVRPNRGVQESEKRREWGDVAVPMEKLLLTADQAALALSLGRTKVYELMAAGELASVRIGAARRIPRTGLVDYVRRLEAEEGRVDPQPQFSRAVAHTATYGRGGDRRLPGKGRVAKAPGGDGVAAPP